MKGADERSPRWRHLCVLAGLLIGFEGRGKRSVSNLLRRKLENATVKAVNLALQDGEFSDDLAENSICMLVSHVFDLLSDIEKANLNSNLLLPILIRALFFSREGLHYGYFLSTIDSDIVQRGGVKFEWSPNSSTYLQYRNMATGPLIDSLASLSRLTAFCVEHVPNAGLLLNMITDISSFTRSLCVQWRQNKLSEIDITEESMYLSEESLKTTLPLLWRVLKSTMFAIVLVLRPILGRVLGDNRVPADRGEFSIHETFFSRSDETQLRTWRFKRYKYYETCILCLRGSELRTLRNILSCVLLLLIFYRNTQFKLKPSFGRFDHRQQAAYHGTLWIAVSISTS